MHGVDSTKLLRKARASGTEGGSARKDIWPPERTRREGSASRRPSGKRCARREMRTNTQRISRRSRQTQAAGGGGGRAWICARRPPFLDMALGRIRIPTRCGSGRVRGGETAWTAGRCCTKRIGGMKAQPNGQRGNTVVILGHRTSEGRLGAALEAKRIINGSQPAASHGHARRLAAAESCISAVALPFDCQPLPRLGPRSPCSAFGSHAPPVDAEQAYELERG